MNIEELQDALRIVTKAQIGGLTLDEETQYKAVMVIVKAVRLVADPNIEAAFWLSRKLLGNLGTRQLVRQIVAAALTPGDTDGS